MSAQLNPYAAPKANVDDGEPDLAVLKKQLRRRFRSRIIWTSILASALIGMVLGLAGPDASAFLSVSLFGAILGALFGWFVSGVLWHPYWLVKQLRGRSSQRLA